MTDTIPSAVEELPASLRFFAGVEKLNGETALSADLEASAARIEALSRDLSAAAERELALQDDVRRASARVEALEAAINNRWLTINGEEPPKGSTFVAIMSDGSGAKYGFRDDAGDYYDAEGEEETTESIALEGAIWTAGPTSTHQPFFFGDRTGAAMAQQIARDIRAAIKGGDNAE